LQSAFEFYSRSVLIGYLTSVWYLLLGIMYDRSHGGFGRIYWSGQIMGI
jgi:hypothetical protein